MNNYICSCVNFPPHEVDALHDMIDGAREISRRTFVRRVNTADRRLLEQELGYARHPKQGLTMAADWSVSYHKSFLRGKRIYFLTWSAIEHIFG